MQEGLSRKTKKERMMVLAEKEHFGSADVSNTERNSFVFVPSVTEQFVFTRKKGEKKTRIINLARVNSLSCWLFCF